MFEAGSKNRAEAHALFVRQGRDGVRPERPPARAGRPPLRTVGGRRCHAPKGKSARRRFPQCTGQMRIWVLARGRMKNAARRLINHLASDVDTQGTAFDQDDVSPVPKPSLKILEFSIASRTERRR